VGQKKLAVEEVMKKTPSERGQRGEDGGPADRTAFWKSSKATRKSGVSSHSLLRQCATSSSLQCKSSAAATAAAATSVTWYSGWLSAVLLVCPSVYLTNHTIHAPSAAETSLRERPRLYHPACLGTALCTPQKTLCYCT